MGNEPSRHGPLSASFAGVLPGAATSDSTSVPSAASKRVSGDANEAQRAPRPTSQDAAACRMNDESRRSMRITPTPAHALLQEPVHQPPVSNCTRDDAATARETHDPDFAIPESVRKARVLGELAGVCSEILPQFLYVSSLEVARDREKLRALGITHVVNCCKELCSARAPAAANDGADGSEPQTLQLALRDDVHEDLSWFFYQVIDFVQSARASQQSPPSRVLVHCHQGVSRSCALVVAFVMYQQQHQGLAPSFRDAMAFVKSKRPIASPNTAFLCQLIEWERELSSFSLSSPVNALLRLAPHAAHDPATLVLKSCFRPDAAAQRHKVVVPVSGSFGDADEALRRWLYTRGIFVFLRRAAAPSRGSSYTIVIWRGHACDIPGGLDAAKPLVEQMARVHLWGAPAQADIEVIEEGALKATTVDHFGYARELSWITRDGGAAADTRPSASDSAAGEGVGNEVLLGGTESATHIEEHEATAQKPLLFVLEDIGTGSGSWDHLKVYDSEDLTSSDAFLLFLPPSHHCRHFLWLGAARSLEQEAIARCAENHVRAMRVQASGATSGVTEPSDLVVEQEGAESDAFWTAFEQGY